MIVKPVTEIGVHKPACVETVRVAAGLVTNTAQIRKYNQKRRGLPIDQCGARAAYLVDDRPLCRAHAGATALAHIIQKGNTIA